MKRKESEGWVCQQVGLPTTSMTYVSDANGNIIQWYSGVGNNERIYYDVIDCCNEFKEKMRGMIEIDDDKPCAEMWLSERWADEGCYREVKYCPFCGKKIKFKKMKSK